MAVLESIDHFIASLQLDEIPKKRKAQLQHLVDFIQNKVQEDSSIKLNFICTHNSRRSILTQVWAQTFAYYFKLKQFQSYSGGTEPTAVYSLVLKTLENIGFQVTLISSTKNPIYAIKFSQNEPAIVGFSKTYDHNFNPKSEFAAILTCSQADSSCPFIAGAEKRISITFEDPKSFDNTPQQSKKYFESNLQIATELFYVFSKINT